MTVLYSKESRYQELFRDADDAYESIKDHLLSREWGVLEHGELERRLTPEGWELMRRLLQSHYTLRGQARPVMAVVGMDGAERTHIRPETSREVETVFGTVEAEREAYSGRGLSALHPVDADLNLPQGRFSHEVERQVALGVAEKSFDGTVRLIGRTTGAAIAKRQAEELARSAASDFSEFYEEREFDPATADETGALMILSFDQKGVVMRPEDLREATRKVGENYRRKLQTRHCKGEKYGRKRMATVATVYTIQPHWRTAQEFIDGLRKIVRDVKPEKKPRPESKRLWASLEELPQDVIKNAFEEALKRDPDHKKRWYVLIDGDDDLEVWVRQAAMEYGVDITIGLDVIHALQYLWKAGTAFENEGTPELENWVLERLLNILNGKVSDVAAGMRRSATLRDLDEEQREPVDKAANYFLNRTQLMRYDELLVAGAPIATGVIEGGCKYLVNDRLDVTGATWSMAGAEAVLRLRALVVSGDFDEYWKFHETQQRTRNHDAYYAGGHAPKVKQSKLCRGALRVIKSG